MNLKFNYVVVNNTPQELNEIIDRVFQNAEEELQSSLTEKISSKKSFYDEDRQWTPFEGISLFTLIKSCCESALERIQIADVVKFVNQNDTFEDCINRRQFRDLEDTKVFFVDIFAIYNRRFRAFFDKYDLTFSDPETPNRLCFVIPKFSSIKMTNHLLSDLEKFEELFSTQYSYEEGLPHRFAFDINDLKGFINGVIYGTIGTEKPNFPNVFDQDYRQQKSNPQFK